MVDILLTSIKERILWIQLSFLKSSNVGLEKGYWTNAFVQHTY